MIAAAVASTLRDIEARQIGSKSGVWNAVFRDAVFGCGRIENVELHVHALSSESRQPPSEVVPLRAKILDSMT